MGEKGWYHKEKYSLGEIHAPPVHKTAFETGKILGFYVRGHPEAKVCLQEWTITQPSSVYTMGSSTASMWGKKDLTGKLEGSNLPCESFDLVGRFELPDGSWVEQAIEGVCIVGAETFGFGAITAYNFQAIRLGPVEPIIKADYKESTEPPKPTRMELLIL